MHEGEPNDTQGIKVNILRPSEAGWGDNVDALRIKLGAPKNPELFPPHFIKKTLISIGGSVIEFKDGNELLGAGFVFPRRQEDGTGFTLRFHSLSQRLTPELALFLTEEVVRDSSGAQLQTRLYVPSGRDVDRSLDTVPEDGFRIERTPPQEGAKIRNLQREIWEVSDDFLYPADMHTTEFSLPTSLVAYIDGKAIGFLFGFDKFCLKELPEGLRGYITNPIVRQESQLMGVLPDQRSRSIALRLKLRQAEQAIQDGTEIINWTFDPLLSQNAVLNLKKLRGVIWEHHPNYYNYASSGANRLTQVPASRFSVSWLMSSPRVRGLIEGAVPQDEILKDALLRGDIPIVNSTSEYDLPNGEETERTAEAYHHSLDAPEIAIEVPVNWVSIQEGDIGLAQQWRSVTDNIFQEYIGSSTGKYAITDSVTLDKNGSSARVFLIGKSIDQIEKVFLGVD